MLAIVLSLIALVAIGYGAWQVRQSWGDHLAVAVAVAGLALTLFVPFGSIGTIVAAVWLYHQASTDLMRRMARRDDVDNVAALPARSPDFSSLLWAGAAVVLIGSLASTAYFGMPMDRLDDAAVADFAGDEVEHAVPDELTEEPGGLDDDAPGAEDVDGHPPAGEQGYLFIEDQQGDIPLATEDHAYDPMVEAVMGDDTEALQDLVAADNVVVVDDDTPVEILETAGPASRVEITDGPQTETDGWAPYRWTHETPRDQ